MDHALRIGDAVAALDIYDRPGEEIIIVEFLNGNPKHRVVDDYQRAQPLKPNTYVATGRFRTGTVRDNIGRSADNVASVFALAIDVDLKDRLGVKADEVQALEDAALVAGLEGLRGEMLNVCRSLNLPPNYIVESGYGFALWYMLDDDDQTDLERIRKIYRRLVAVFNRTAGRTLADRGVSDAGTRVMRVPGAPNTKVVDRPRETSVTYAEPSAWKLDALEARITTAEPASAEPTTPAPIVRDNISGVDLDPGAANEIVSLVRPYWSSGQRHMLALALAGWLKRNGVSQMLATSIVDGCAIDDDEREDRLKAVETTYGKSDAQIVGFTQIREMLPGPTIRRIDEMLSAFWRAQQASLQPPETEVVMSGKSAGALETLNDRAELASAEEPDDLSAREIEFDPLPDEIYQGALAEYLDIMTPCTEAPASFHVGSFLAVNGALAGRTAYTPYASKQVFANQYIMLVGSTGTSKKDTAIRFATDKFAGLEQPSSLILRTRARWSKLDDIGSDVKMLDHLNTNPNTLLVVPELNAQLAKMRRKGTEALFDLILTLWDANERYQNKTMSNDISVYRPTLSILAAIQPTRLRNAMNEEIISSGFMNRWLVIPGEAPSPIADPPTVNVSNSLALLEELSSRYDDLEVLSRGEGPIAIPFSDNSSLRWKQYYEKLWYARKRDPEAGEFSSRYPDLVRKVALTFALTDLSRAVPTAIEWKHVEAAMMLIDWQAKQVEKIRKEWGGSDETRIETRILSALGNDKHRTDPETKQHRCVSARKLKQLTYIKGVPTSVWSRALQSLVKSGDVAECYGGAGGYELGKFAERRKVQG